MRSIVEMTAIFLVLLAVGVAGAEKSTELFIPIGQSLGLSKEGKTLIGNIVNVSGSAIVILTFDNKTVPVKMSDRTNIYVDRSYLKLLNRYGTFSNIELGGIAEVYAPRDNVAEWVKIRGIE